MTNACDISVLGNQPPMIASSMNLYDLVMATVKEREAEADLKRRYQRVKLEEYEELKQRLEDALQEIKAKNFEITRLSSQHIVSIEAFEYIQNECALGWTEARVYKKENRDLLDKIKQILKMWELQSQPGNYDVSEYMRGLANGLALALNCFREEDHLELFPFVDKGQARKRF